MDSLIAGGGLAIAASMLIVATTHSFLPLLLALVVSYPASGAFVTLSQATLMDSNPGREEQMMARWTVVGSLGYIVGPLMVTAAFALGFGWRGLYAGLAVCAAALAAAYWRISRRGSPRPNSRPAQSVSRPAQSVSRPAQSVSRPAQSVSRPEGAPTGDAAGVVEDEKRYGWREVWRAMRDPVLLRWIALLHASDLMLDILLGFVALYFHDELGVSDAGASAAVLALYVGWLGIGWLPMKYVLVALVQFGTLGWYQVLQGRAYAALPGRSGTVVALNSLAGLVSSAIPLGLGLVAERFGLTAALWLLATGPVALILFLPRGEGGTADERPHPRPRSRGTGEGR